jgi:hypothetical protein
MSRRLLRRPDEIYLLIIGTIALLPTLFGAPSESVAEAIIWPPLRYVWAATFIGLAGVIIALSIRPRELITTMIRLRRAHCVLAASSAVYAMVVLSVMIHERGWIDGLKNGWIAASFTLGYSGVRVIRAREIRRWLSTQKRPPR